MWGRHVWPLLLPYTHSHYLSHAALIFFCGFVQHGEENVNKLLIANKCDYPEADRVRPGQ